MTYLDAASTERLHPAAREVLLAAYDDGWADPARLYRDARRARLLLDNAREVIAAAVGARPDEVVLTASGTQACHLGVLGALAGRRRAGRTERDGQLLVTSAVEHSAVLAAGALHVRDGGRHETVPVDRDGLVDLEALRSSLVVGAGGTGGETGGASGLASGAGGLPRGAGGLGSGAGGLPRGGVGLLAVQSANHEVGTRQPFEQVTALAREAGVPLLVDAAQSLPWGRVPDGWSVLTGSAHKWGGPPGVGVLAVRRGTRFRSVLPEDERGGGLVPGFENVPGALAAAAALHARLGEAEELAARLSPLVDRIRAQVPQLVPDVEVVGHPTQRLPHVVTFSCLYVDGEALLTALDAEGFAVSSGSSCTASTLRPSHVLEAMGVLTHGNVRVSLSRDTTEQDVDRFLAVLPGAVARTRAQLGAERL